jgi:hypothetical protein
MSKRKFPLIILTQLNHLKENYPTESKRVKAVNSLLRFEDKNEDSDFYFQINSYTFNVNNEFQYSATYEPTSENVLTKKTRNLNFEGLESTLKNWGNILKLFNDTEHFDDDGTIKHYTKEFFDEYQLIEEDANINPFDLRRQILIDNYLANSVKYLENYEEINHIDLTEEKNEAIELRKSLTALTKNEVILRLSKFWALSRKKGLPILKEIFFELAKEIINEIGKKMIGL